VAGPGEGCNVLVYACVCGFEDVICEFLSTAKNPDEWLMHRNRNPANSLWQPPLHVTAFCGHRNSCVALLAFANEPLILLQQKAAEGLTPYETAKKRGHSELLPLLQDMNGVTEEELLRYRSMATGVFDEIIRRT